MSLFKKLLLGATSGIGPPEINFLLGLTNGTATSITWSNQNIGAPKNGNRYILLGITYDDGSLSEITTASVGGIECVPCAAPIGHSGTGIEWWWCWVPTGSTVDISLTWSNSTNATQVAVYEVYNAVNVFSTGDDKVDSAREMNFDLTAIAGKSVIAVGMGDSNASGQSATWTAGFSDDLQGHFGSSQGFSAFASKAINRVSEGTETVRGTFGATPAGGWEYGQSLNLALREGTISFVGRGYVNDNTAPLPMKYTNVDAGSAPSAGDLVIWWSCGHSSGSTTVSVPSGWTLLAGGRAGSAGSGCVFIESIPQSDIDTPPNMYTDGQAGRDSAVWIAFRLTGDIKVDTQATLGDRVQAGGNPAQRSVALNSFGCQFITIGGWGNYDNGGPSLNGLTYEDDGVTLTPDYDSGEVVGANGVSGNCTMSRMRINVVSEIYENTLTELQTNLNDNGIQNHLLAGRIVIN